MVISPSLDWLVSFIFQMTTYSKDGKCIGLRKCCGTPYNIFHLPMSSSSNTSKKSSTTTTAGGRGSQPQATRRSQSDERSDTLKLVKDFLNPQPPPVTQATPTHTTSKQDRLTEEVVERKTTTIIDELSQNQDYKEAVECVIELESPGLMNVFVQTGINHSLEKSSAVRVSVGKLFDTLVAKDLLTTEKLISG
ncbi:PREDICTED: eukaryotic translation initiation factor 4 gamma 3-like, partial [Amphimedon queenslandica]|uniref:MI domain-containing protein n=1 Tax=Amphimedon queenslandica TaxID=400682 RepID=A0AAN0JX45_AMPQE